jgi:hypothetical protein
LYTDGDIDISHSLGIYWIDAGSDFKFDYNGGTIEARARLKLSLACAGASSGCRWCPELSYRFCYFLLFSFSPRGLYWIPYYNPLDYVIIKPM